MPFKVLHLEAMVTYARARRPGFVYVGLPGRSLSDVSGVAWKAKTEVWSSEQRERAVNPNPETPINPKKGGSGSSFIPVGNITLLVFSP